MLTMKKPRAGAGKRNGPSRRTVSGGDDLLVVIRQVRKGFPFRRLAELQHATALPWEQVSRLVQVPRRTLARRQVEGRLRPDESDRVLRAARLWNAAVAMFEGDAEAARRWLQSAQPALAGQTPLEMASTEVGAREVERLIQRLEYGVIA